MYHDPTMYKRCSAPHESVDEATRRADLFFDAVRAAREAHHMANVVIMAQCNAMDGDQEKALFFECQYGDAMQWKRLAFALAGILKKRDEELSAALLAGKFNADPPEPEVGP
jgi:hypothetical protein